MKLTIVVPTIAGRGSLLSRCLWSMPADAVVLVVEGDAKLGDKLNHAFALVDTSHVAVVDDDDYLAADYAEIAEHLDADYVGFDFLELVNGAYDNTAASRGDCEVWGRRTRGPVAKCPIRADIARRVRFGNDYKADRRWSASVRPLIGSSAHVARPLYIHDWWPDHSSFGDGNAHRDVGLWPHRPVERITLGEAHA